jgi:hypothetical protein
MTASKYAAAGTFVQLDPGAKWHRVFGRSARVTRCGLAIKGGSDWFETDVLPAYRVADCCIVSISAIEGELSDLYRAGHSTGHGAGGPSHPECAGCDEARRLAGEWDAYWRGFEARRLAPLGLTLDANGVVIRKEATR